MNKPKATPNSPHPAIVILVGDGLQRLPGASVLVRPSMNRTLVISNTDNIPRIDV